METKQTRNVAGVGQALGQAALMLVLAVGLGGCKTASIKNPGTVIGPFHKPANYNLANGVMPDDMRRVALLPLTSAVNTVEHQSGRQILQKFMQAEIAKSGLFEVVYVSETKMGQLTGRPAWRMIDELPVDFIEQITREYDCQGVLFSHLTVYQPYPPLSIGWRMGLVHLRPESNNGSVVWELDDVFNAGEKSVINSARRNAIKNGLSDPELDAELGLLNSPRRFGRYTAEAVVATMSRLSPDMTFAGVDGDKPRLRAQGGFFNRLFSRR
ncbi:MAG: hypothetical protein H8E20_02150 [Verrucomicrobia bacterium]|nr:hypothetical protein [Verrucomicrobiota bacterium]